MTPTRRKLTSAVILLLLVAHGVKGGGSIIGGAATHFIVVHETADDTAEFGRLLVSLRTGSAAEYFSEGGRRLSILDDDATNEDGKPVILKEQLEGVTLPALLCFDKSGKLVAKESIPKDATKETVVSISRRHGA